MSVRSTSVLTKKPTRSSSALSVRPAIGLPIGMSVPAPSRVSSAASPACSTMNRLAPLSRASASRPRCRSAPMLQRHTGRRDSSTPPAAAGRSAARSDPAGPASASRPERQLPRDRAVRRRSRRPAPRAATACSRHIAPAAPASSGAPPAQRARIGRRKIARTAAPATSRRPQCDAAAAAARARSSPSTNRCARSGSSRARSKPRRAAAASAAGKRRLARPRRPRAAAAPRCAARISCRGTPSRVREDRAQALVPLHHVAQRRLQRRTVERARSAAPPSGSL